MHRAAHPIARQPDAILDGAAFPHTQDRCWHGFGPLLPGDRAPVVCWRTARICLAPISTGATAIGDSPIASKALRRLFLISRLVWLTEEAGLLMFRYVKRHRDAEPLDQPPDDKASHACGTMTHPSISQRSRPSAPAIRSINSGLRTSRSSLRALWRNVIQSQRLQTNHGRPRDSAAVADCTRC